LVSREGTKARRGDPDRGVINFINFGHLDTCRRLEESQRVTILYACERLTGPARIPCSACRRQACARNVPKVTLASPDGVQNWGSLPLELPLPGSGPARTGIKAGSESRRCLMNLYGTYPGRVGQGFLRTNYPRSDQARQCPLTTHCGRWPRDTS